MPHLRIENRILPSGPTPRDEIANAGLWFGLISGVLERFGDIANHMSFDDARSNFLAAARHGIDAQLAWCGRDPEPADKLMLDELLPLARDGLGAAGLDQENIDLYLGVIEERVRSRRTGAQWQLQSMAELADQGPLSERLSAITAATLARQRDGEPVAKWDLARLEEGAGWKQSYSTVEHCMDTDIVTVNEHEPVDLVANLMVWKNIRHVMVEDDTNRLVGLVSQRKLLGLVGTYHPEERDDPMPVSDIMQRDPVTVAPESPTVDAIALMRSNGWACLPVVKDDHLVGVLTESQLMRIAGELLEQKLRE
jgi:CBS domain-containing protein